MLSYRFPLSLAMMTGLSLSILPPVFAGTTQPYDDPVEYSLQPDASLTPAEARDAAAISQHQLKLADGRIMNYTATAGHLSTEGNKQASIFYIAYTANGQNLGDRPITFLFNGGGGYNQAYTSAAYLHMTAWAPIRMINNNIGSSDSPIYEIKPAPDSLLKNSDLVFIDPPGAGFSQAIKPARNEDFYSIEEDGKVIRDFIKKYLKNNNRELSPKFVYGESSGGARAIHLSKKLDDAGIHLDGLVLHAPAIGRYDSCNYSGITEEGFDPNAIYSCAGKIPTVAALSHYYGLAGKGRDRDSYINEVMNFVKNIYLPQEINSIKTGEQMPAETVDKLIEYTGFSRETLGDFPFQSGLNNSTPKYIAALGLQEECGDGRGSAANPLADHCPIANMYDRRRVRDQYYGNDWETINIFNQTDRYLQTDLGYTARVQYDCRTGDCQKDSRSSARYNPIVTPEHPWIQEYYYDAIPVLEQVMQQNPELQVQILTGYYDEMTNYGSHMMAFSEPELDQTRVHIAGFPAGHMFSQDNTARAMAKETLDNFYSDSVTLPPEIALDRTSIIAVGTSNHGFGYPVTAHSNQDDVSFRWERVAGDSRIVLKLSGDANSEIIVVPKNLFDTSAKFRVTATNSKGKSAEQFVTILVTAPQATISGPNLIRPNATVILQATANFDQASYRWKLMKDNQLVVGGIHVNGQLREGLAPGNYIAMVEASSDHGARFASAQHAITVIKSTINPFEVGKFYQAGDKVSYQGQEYQVRQSHRSQSDWTPDRALSLWLKR